MTDDEAWSSLADDARAFYSARPWLTWALATEILVDEEDAHRRWDVMHKAKRRVHEVAAKGAEQKLHVVRELVEWVRRGDLDRTLARSLAEKIDDASMP